MVSDAYSVELRSIDDELARWAARRLAKVAAGEGGVPGQDVIDQLSRAHGIPARVLTSLYRLLTPDDHDVARPQVRPEELESVVPLLKRARKDGILYQISRMEQYPNASLIVLDAIALEDAASELVLQVKLVIEADSVYRVYLQSGFGGPGRASTTYVVTPRLPDDTSAFRLRLVPDHHASLHRLPRRVLDRAVEFE